MTLLRQTPLAMRVRALLAQLPMLGALLCTLFLSSAGAATSPKPATRIVFSGAAVLYGGGYDQQLYSVQPSGRAAAQLTIGKAPASDPIPSPDGRLILFMRGAAGEPEDAGELWVMKPDGSAQRRLADTAREPTWLPDSRRIAYDGWDASGDFVGIYTIRTDGRANRLLVKGGRSPAWSTNGKTFSYVIPDPLDDHVYVRRSGHEFNFVSDTELVDHIAVSPDGRFLALSAKGETAIHRFDGEEVEILGRGDGFTGPFPAQSPTWSPGSDRLAFADAAGVEVMDVAWPQTKPPLRTLTHNRGISWLAWSPSGDEIGFTRDAGALATGSIWKVSLAGRLRHVFTPVGVTGSLGWSGVESGLHFKPPLPDSIVVGGEVRNRAPIDSFDADGERVAFPACGRFDVWSRPGSKLSAIRSFRLHCSIGTNADVYSLALAGNRIALGSMFGGTSKQAQLEVWSLVDPSVKLVASSEVPGGDRRGDVRVGDLVGDHDLLAFGSWAFCNEVGQRCIGEAVDTDKRVLSASVWRVREASFPGLCPNMYALTVNPKISTFPGVCQELAREQSSLIPLDADSGRILAASDNTLGLLNQDGARRLTVPVKALAAQLSGPDLVAVVQGVLYHYDAENGALLHTWPLPDVSTGPSCGSCPLKYPRFRLEDVAPGLAAYILDGTAHVLRLSDGADAIVGMAKSARFGDSGLFYAYDGRYPWRGRIRFVSFDKLPLR